MNGDAILAGIFGLLIGFLIMGVLLGNVAHNNYQKYLTMKTAAFHHEQQWMDALEQAVPKQFMMVAEGAEDPVVIRGRPDIAERQERASSGVSWDDPDVSSHIIKLSDLDDVPPWEGEQDG
jgi:hypothetical protein